MSNNSQDEDEPGSPGLRQSKGGPMPSQAAIHMIATIGVIATSCGIPYACAHDIIARSFQLSCDGDYARSNGLVDALKILGATSNEIYNALAATAMAQKEETTND